MNYITVGELIELGACDDGVSEFMDIFGDRAPLCLASLCHVGVTQYAEWALDRLGGESFVLGDPPGFIPSEIAFLWATTVGDVDSMKDHIANSEHAYHWAMALGDHETMRDRVCDSCWAYRWARDIGDCDIMRDRVTSARWVYHWALYIGDYDIMRNRLTGAWVDQLERAVDQLDRASVALVERGYIPRRLRGNA